MKKIIDLVGQKRGSVTVVSFALLGKFRNARWNCICECGNVMVLDSHSFRQRKENSRCNKCVTHCYLDEALSSKKNLFASYKKTCAENRGISFSLKFEEFLNLVQLDCYYCGTPPANFKRVFDARKGLFYNGLDRIDNTKGYHIDNVKTCCTDCNYAKGTLTKEEFINWVKRCYNHLNKIA